MGKLVSGFRPGIRIHTIAGTFINGSEPTKEMVVALKAMGYKVEGSKETLEGALPVNSTMRADQIDAENRARAQADEKAAQVEAKRAATQGKSKPDTADNQTGAPDVQKTDGEQADGPENPVDQPDGKDVAGN